MTRDTHVARDGTRLLNAVEHVIDDCDALVAHVEAVRREVETDGDSEAQVRERVAARIIASHSSRSAIAGGAAALPALLPGGGTIVALTAGAMADMAMMLKHEVEMALCLTHLFGYDIRDERERWLAYALVAVNIYEAKRGESYFHDLADAQMEAIAKYTPRQLSKLVITLLGKIALLMVSKGLVRALPLVGIAVGAGANKLLTTSVGWRCVEALARRGGGQLAHEDDIVDAKVT